MRTIDEIWADLSRFPTNVEYKTELMLAYSESGDLASAGALRWMDANNKTPNPWYTNADGKVSYMWSSPGPPTCYELPEELYEYISNKTHEVFPSYRQAVEALIEAHKKWKGE